MGLLDERMRDPVHMGPLPDATGHGEVGNPACGDVVRFHVRTGDGIVQAARFESVGSAYQVAAASVLCDCVIGQTVEAARSCDEEEVLRRLPDLPRNKHHLARLAVDALRRALQDEGRRGAVPQRQILDAEAARRFVADHVARGTVTTDAIDRALAASGAALPGGTARFLAGERKAGRLAGSLDAARGVWSWSAVGTGGSGPQDAQRGR